MPLSRGKIVDAVYQTVFTFFDCRHAAEKDEKCYTHKNSRLENINNERMSTEALDGTRNSVGKGGYECDYDTVKNSRVCVPVLCLVFLTNFQCRIVLHNHNKLELSIMLECNAVLQTAFTFAYHVLKIVNISLIDLTRLS